MHYNSQLRVKLNSMFKSSVGWNHMRVQAQVHYLAECSSAICLSVVCSITHNKNKSLCLAPHLCTFRVKHAVNRV